MGDGRALGLFEVRAFRSPARVPWEDFEARFHEIAEFARAAYAA